MPTVRASTHVRLARDVSLDHLEPHGVLGRLAAAAGGWMYGTLGGALAARKI